MDSSMVEIISERFVKPSSPTPPSLRSYKLSFLDQKFHKVYVPRVFFYSNHQVSVCPTEKISELHQISLSKTLTYYYPFAGRFSNNVTYVDCNDEGAHLVEVRVKCSMSKILKSTTFGDIFPTNSIPVDDLPLFVQLSYFDCGGIAVTARLSHAVADGPAACAFINDWAAMARDSTHIPSPQFIASSLGPPPADDQLLSEPTPPLTTENCLKRRFFFQASKIAQLKALVANDNNSRVQNPTRVEVVAALLYRCALKTKSSLFNSFQRSELWNAVNLRQIRVPPLPQKSIGNLAAAFSISTTKENEMELPELVFQLRKANIRLRNEYKGKAKNEIYSAVSENAERLEADNGNYDKYRCSSSCRFPFYEVNFGWGRPLWACVTNVTQVDNTFLLMDSKEGDGIEAYVILSEQIMSVFERDKELLAFASSNA